MDSVDFIINVEYLFALAIWVNTCGPLSRNSKAFMTHILYITFIIFIIEVVLLFY